jgi:integrase
MATITKRTWTSRGPTGHRVKRVAYGYSLVVDGKQVRKYDASWSRQDALEALAKRTLEREAPTPPPAPKTFAAVADEYLEYKRGKGKRSVDGDALMLKRLRAWFGADTPVADLTAHRISQYERARVAETSRLGRPVSPATVNRELALMRHLLRLARRWGYVKEAPEIELAREPEGRLRFLSEDEAVRLLDACRRSQNPHLAAVVTVALNTGMRRGEVMGLTWERVDMARGVLMLEQTKNGRRREVPMNRAVYDALAAVRGDEADGPVFRKSSGAAWGSVPDGVRARVRGGQGRRLPVPRPAPHVRLMPRHARPKLEGGPGAARPPVVRHDAAVRPPEPGPPPRGRGEP